MGNTEWKGIRFLSQQHYEPEFKQQIVRLHIEEGRTYRSLTAEYGVSKASISKWCKEFSEECQQNASKNLTAQNDLELMKENRRLREELADARKENLFLKKQRHSSQRESTRGISIHRWTSESVRRPVVAAAFWNLSECLLQLPKAQAGKRRCPKTEHPASNSSPIPWNQWRCRVPQDAGWSGAQRHRAFCPDGS